MSRNSLKSVCRLINEITNEIPIEQQFAKDLERSIELTDIKNSRKPSQTYKPSSLNCLRQMYYQVKGVEPEQSESNYSSIGICNSGSDIHNWIQNSISHMKENGIDCEYIDVEEFVKNRNLEDIEVKGKQGNETKLYNKKLNISFLCDGIIKYKGIYRILEIKSETNGKWTSRSSVDYKHHNQAICYSTCLGLDEVVFLYVSRDLLFIKPFLYQVNQEMKDNLVNRLHSCDKYLIDNIVPPKEDTTSCTYCKYKKQCGKDN